MAAGGKLLATTESASTNFKLLVTDAQDRFILTKTVCLWQCIIHIKDLSALKGNTDLMLHFFP